MNAITLLKRDHRRVERLLEQYRGSADGEKRAILEQVTEELIRHMAAEEKELYPVLRDALPNGWSFVSEAVRRHQEARGLLADLATCGSTGFDADAKVATLRQSIARHVEDEEATILSSLEQLLGAKQAEALGSRIEKAKESSPCRPARSDVAASPGASVGGMVAAAADRVAQLLILSERGRRPSRVASANTDARRKRAQVRKPTAPRRHAHM